MRAIIFANGELDHLPVDIRTDDCLIAVDGGAWHCLRLGLTPDIVLGDFDSLPEQERAHLKMSGSEVISYPTRKDEIDLELALLLAIERCATEVLIYAALGARWDMTMANLLLLSHPKLSSADIRIIDGPQVIRLIRAGEQLILKGQKGDTVSLIPLGGNAHGITTTGLEYALKHETLRFGETKGISNLLVDGQGTVTLEDGSLLCILIHQTKNLKDRKLTG